jgi:sugar lactone lactonase YvrE
MGDVAVSIISDIDCHLGEGPSYDPATDTLFWFDIVGRRLLEKRWPDGETTIHDLPLMASALAVTTDGRQAIVTETGLHLRDTSTGALTMVMPIEADDGATRSNDSRVHPSGAFWIGTMGKQAQREAGAIYWYRNGQLKTLFPRISIPNSICFAPDGGTAWFADTAINRLWRVACDPRTGLPEGDPEIVLDQKSVEGGIDGSVMDAEGMLWNARWGSGALDCYDPSGRHLRRIALPARQSSCPAFVGPEADRIVVTSAWQGLGSEARMADPHAGKTFLVDLAVRGRHEPLLAL